jgi:3-deoxy-manno-octulosonate cytidylyltransferase (CMP-KDO synthetase)
MRIIVVIPARYNSSRFPGKPLANICGVPMIKRVWEQCCLAIGKENIVIATDDMRIQQYCTDHHMSRVLMTSPNCLTGTDRVAEVATLIEADVYVNVQGDEPLINPEDILHVIEAYKNSNTEVVNAMSRIKDEEEFFSYSIPKVIFNEEGNLLYMSRAPIPSNKKNAFLGGWKQVCIYAFSKNSLMNYRNNKKTSFENIEDIEILRFIERGCQVKMVEVNSDTISVDFPEDIIKVEKRIRE